MKRPVGVVLSAVLFGLLAALNLLGAFGMAALGFLSLTRHIPAPPASPLPATFFVVVLFGLSLFATAIGVWCLLTLIGLVRLRSWARYSALVIGGCMAVLGSVSLLTTLAMPYLTHSMPSSHSADTKILFDTFLVLGIFYLLLAAVGVALLVYYNLARTRTLFLLNVPVHTGAFATSTGKRRPTAVTVISWIYIVSAPFTLIYLALPMPAFLCGLVLHGLAARLVYIAFAAIGLCIGYGLYRLHNSARVAAFALFPIGVLQILVLLTPWGARQFHVYMNEVTDWSAGLSGAAQPNVLVSKPATVLFLLLGMAGYAFILWLLYRHRAAFTSAPPPPPAPDLPQTAAV